MNMVKIAKLNRGFILLFILAIGFFLRFYQISGQSFWRNEIHTLISSSQNSIGEIFSERLERGHSPLYFIFIHFWIKAFGVNELTLRLPSVLFGCFSLVIVYFLAKELFDRKTALFVLLLQSMCAIDVIYAQEARMYTFVGFFALLSNLYLIQYLKAAEARRAIITKRLYLVFSIFCVLLSLSGFLVILPQLLYLLTLIKKNNTKARGILPYLACALILSLFFVLLAAGKKELLGSNYPADLTAALRFLACFTPFALGERIFGNTILGNCALIVYLVAIGFAFIFFYKKNRGSLRRLVLFNVLTPPLILILITYTFTKILIPRYIFFISPYLSVIIAYSLLVFFKNKFKYFVILPLALINLVPLRYYYNEHVKPDWRGVVNFVSSSFRNFDIISFYPEGYCLELEYYNKGKNNIFYVPDPGKLEILEFVSRPNSLVLAFKLKKGSDADLGYLSRYRVLGESTVPSGNYTGGYIYELPVNRDNLAVIYPDIGNNAMIPGTISKFFSGSRERIFFKGWMMLRDDIKVVVFFNQSIPDNI